MHAETFAVLSHVPFGGLLMVAIPMLFAIRVGRTGVVGFSAMILYLFEISDVWIHLRIPLSD